MYNTKLEDFETDIRIPIVLIVQNSEHMNQIFKEDVTKLDFVTYSINLFLNELRKKNKNRFKIDLGIVTFTDAPKILRGIKPLEEDYLFKRLFTTGNEANLERGAFLGVYLTTNESAKYFFSDVKHTVPWVILFAERKVGTGFLPTKLETIDLEETGRLEFISFVFDDLKDDKQQMLFSKRGNTLLTEDKIIDLAEEIILKSVDFYLRLKE